jgi:pilus assembly protein Flp/PilA
MELQETKPMAKVIRAGLHLWLDARGQDMIEYALLAGSIAVVVAGFLPPSVMPGISTIFSKIVSSFNAS